MSKAYQSYESMRKDYLERIQQYKIELPWWIFMCIMEIFPFVAFLIGYITVEPSLSSDIGFFGCTFIWGVIFVVTVSWLLECIKQTRYYEKQYECIKNLKDKHKGEQK